MSEGAGLRLVSPDLVGRDTELATIAQLVGVAGGGIGATVLVSGEAGLGKTMLLGRACDIGRRSGLRVLRGDCLRFEMGRAFGPFVDALHPLEGRASVDAALGRASADAPAASVNEQDRFRAHAAFIRALAEMAEERPLLLAIDDLHWADASALELFAHLSRRRTRGVVLIATYRPDEVGRRPALRRAIADLARDRTWDLGLRRLTSSEVGRMLRLVLGADARISAETREILQAHSAGNPLFLEEMLRALAARGELARFGGGWRLGRIHDVPLPASVQAAVRERFAAFSPVARDVVVTAAIVGEHFDLDILRHASGAAAAEVIAALRDAVAAQLVTELDAREDCFAFRHPLIRDALLEELLRVERRSRHHRVAEALAMRGDADSLSVLAYHWDEAAEREHALDAHERAGESELRRYAQAEALAHFERAIDLVEPDGPRRIALEMRGAAVSRVLGRDRRALDHAATAAELAERRGDRRTLGEALILMHDLARGMFWPRAERGALLERAFDALAPLGDSAALAAAFGARATHLAAGGELSDALVAAEHAVALAEHCSDARRSDAYFHLAAVHMRRWDAGATISALRRGVAAIREEAHIRSPNTVNGVAILANLLERTHGETDEVRSLRAFGLELKERFGTMQTLHQRLHGLLLAGDWDEFIRVQDEHADDPAETTFVLTHQALHRAFVEVARAGPSGLDQARAVYREVTRSEELTESDFVMAEVALVAEDHRLVYQVAERGIAAAMHPDPTGPFLGFVGMYALLAARSARDDQTARTWARRFPDEVSGSSVIAFHPAIADALRFAAIERAWDAGDRETAIAGLAALVSDRQACEQGLPALGPGAARWAMATYFMALREIEMRMERGSRDDRERAEGRLAWVVDLFRRGGATWYLERLRARAERWDIRFPKASATAPVARRLTPREREIALLVARGMTNREIARHLVLSVRTAESHVDGIRAKLGFRTRAQIAAWVTELGER